MACTTYTSSYCTQACGRGRWQFIAGGGMPCGGMPCNSLPPPAITPQSGAESLTVLVPEHLVSDSAPPLASTCRIRPGAYRLAPGTYSLAPHSWPPLCNTSIEPLFRNTTVEESELDKATALAFEARRHLRAAAREQEEAARLLQEVATFPPQMMQRALDIVDLQPGELGIHGVTDGVPSSDARD